MTEHTRYVVDDSVGIKLFVKEELSDIAGALLETMTDNAETRLYVPDLFFMEICGAFRIRKGGCIPQS